MGPLVGPEHQQDVLEDLELAVREGASVAEAADAPRTHASRTAASWSRPS